MDKVVDIERLRDFFKVLGDDTRMRIILLLEESAKNVTEIANALNMTQSAISHQLRTLYDHRVVTYSKAGQERIYEILDPHIYKIIKQARDHIRE
jgi:DNA-binding transcriptional ArsR family regulator